MTAEKETFSLHFERVIIVGSEGDKRKVLVSEVTYTGSEDYDRWHIPIGSESATFTTRGGVKVAMSASAMHGDRLKLSLSCPPEVCVIRDTLYSKARNALISMDVAPRPPAVHGYFRKLRCARKAA
jgi:hypothetical protein